MLLIAGGWSPLAARAPAFATALGATWFLHGAFTFGVRERLTRSSLGRFSGAALGIAGLNFLIYAGLVSRETWPPLAIVMSTGICMVLSYLAYRFFAFR